MKCATCINSIEDERLSVLPQTRICSKCAQRVNPPRVKGRMVYFHKTAPVIEVMDEETFKENSKYYPRTGRGSGVHAMSRTTK